MAPAILSFTSGYWWQKCKQPTAAHYLFRHIFLIPREQKQRVVVEAVDLSALTIVFVLTGESLIGESTRMENDLTDQFYLEPNVIKWR